MNWDDEEIKKDIKDFDGKIRKRMDTPMGKIVELIINEPIKLGIIPNTAICSPALKEKQSQGRALRPLQNTCLVYNIADYKKKNK